MITLLSSESISDEVIKRIFINTLRITLSIYHRDMGDDELEPMGSEQDMLNNMSKITGSIMRACRTYYDTPEEQLVQIISSITVNHYLENGNKRTAVSAGTLYLFAYNEANSETDKTDIQWLISKINELKIIADSFANMDNNFELVREQMIQFAKQKIFN